MMRQKTSQRKGKLRIGDDWNAITIIALSQTNPLKAIAECIENSIDAQARTISVVRGKERGEHYLKIIDDGQGIPRDKDGRPDFTYVATHICDSIKRELKKGGAQGLQGEFGIGLLSFWTVGEELIMTSAGVDGRNYQMCMRKGNAGYSVTERRSLLPVEGVELTIKPLLPAVRQLSGEKIQWYLASELRDRIRTSGVSIKVLDRTARKEFVVEPRAFTGRLLHGLKSVPTALGEIYTEIYLSDAGDPGRVSLCRSGTRILEDIAALDPLNREPWSSASLQGIIDAPFLNITPGTRTGVVHDESLHALSEALMALEPTLASIIQEQRRAEEERASAHILKSVQKALREALMSLPAEEYDWFNIHSHAQRRPGSPGLPAPNDLSDDLPPASPAAQIESAQKQFFEFAGPLFSVRVMPQSCVLPVGESRQLHAVARDRSKKTVDEGLVFLWELVEGGGTLEPGSGELARSTAPLEPGLSRVRVGVTQKDVTCTAEALITVTESLLPAEKRDTPGHQGLPGYTYKKAPGELWRARYDEEQNVIVINNGHRDFVFTSRNKALKIRYIARLFAKELICKNFKGIPGDELLERMIELTLYIEENL